MKLVETKTIENFFTDEELEYLRSFLDKYPESNGISYASEPWMDKDFIERKILAFNPEEERYKLAQEILRKKIDEHFGTNVIIGGWHILTAYWPYRAHTDAVFGEYGIDDNHYGAWTLIIPLDDYDSHTILFDQYSHEAKKMPIHHWGYEKIYKIDDETYQKYLTLEAKEVMEYFSIEQIYKWKKNVCFAASRYKYHGSDDFYNHGLPFKQGIIVWTALPNNE